MALLLSKKVVVLHIFIDLNAIKFKFRPTFLQYHDLLIQTYFLLYNIKSTIESQGQGGGGGGVGRSYFPLFGQYAMCCLLALL